ncbi:MAG: alpha/beta hydrolase [Corynebacterium sp.]|nr:alpha/beta hydrolase [Corynebacterium sp.]
MNAGAPEEQAAFEAADRANFQVGGHKEKLPAQDQLTQLSTYIQAHYPAPDKNPPWSENPSGAQAADTFDARLPDRITHAAMLMLGAAVDHSMPGVAWGTQVTTSPAPAEVGCAAEIITPSQPNGNWAISLHPGGWWKGSGVALEHSWRPEVAAAAERSGVTFLDLDYPLVPEHDLNKVIAAVQRAITWVRAGHPDAKVFAWGYSSGGALAVLNADRVDALALTFPHLDITMLPGSVRAGVDFQEPPNLPPTLLQYANSDSIASTYPWFEQWYDAANLQVREYVSEHRIATPEVIRQRVADVADFFQAQSGTTTAAEA